MLKVIAIIGVLLLALSCGAAILGWLLDMIAPPDPDSDFLRACGWRRAAEDEVAQLKNLDHRAMRKFIRDGEG